MTPCFVSAEEAKQNDSVYRESVWGKRGGGRFAEESGYGELCDCGLRGWGGVRSEHTGLAVAWGKKPDGSRKIHGIKVPHSYSYGVSTTEVSKDA